MRLIVALLPIFAFATSANAWSPFGPKNYDQCVSKNTKDVTDRNSLSSLYASCARDFPNGPNLYNCKKRPLTDSELNALTFQGDGFSTSISVVVYNPHNKLTLGDVIVEIGADNIKPPQRYKLISMPIEPLSTGKGFVTTLVEPVGKKTLALISATTCN